MKGFSHFYCFAAVICSLLIFCSATNAQQQANSQAQQTKAQEQQTKEQHDKATELTYEQCMDIVNATPAKKK